MTHIGRQLEVRDQCVARACDRYQIDRPRHGYWERLKYGSAEGVPVLNNDVHGPEDLVMIRKYKPRLRKTQDNFADAERIAELMNQLIASGCRPTAVFQTYCLEEPENAGQMAKVDAILKEFGPRDHLRSEIVDYLRKAGRALDLPKEGSGSSPAGRIQPASASDDRLTDPDFDVVFQAIVQAKDVTVIGYEALARPKSGHKPDQFFESLSKEDAVVADHRCRRLALSIAESIELNGKLFLNVNPASVCDEKYGIRETIRFAQEIGFPIQRLVFEITEHQSLTDYQAVHAELAFERAEGVQLALDDFGTGFNGVMTLLQTRPDIVKFDMEVLRLLQTGETETVLLQGLIDGCHAIGCKVLAEGVEDRENFDNLKHMGVDYMQGYYLGKPMKRP